MTAADTPPVPTDLAVVLIAAVAANGVIGRDGRVPWDLPADMRHFRETTTGHPVVMGRRTYEGIVAALGEPLPGRTSVVLSTRDLDLPAGAVRASSLAEAIDLAAADARERGVATVYVAGGATVYDQFLPVADRLVLTELDAAHEGDTRFPAWDRSAWREIERDEHEGFAFVTYERAGDGG
jgi:dihydrofolate reductase